MRSHQLITLAAIVTLTVVLSASCAPRDSKKKPDKVSRPFEYSGYTYPEYESYQKRSEYVETRDGVKLAVDIFLPSDGPARESFPVIFQFLPYTRAFAYPNMPWYERIAIRMMMGSSGPVFDAYTMNKAVPLFLSHGYAYVIADMRGTGASFGRAFHPIPENFKDVEDLLEWISNQQWCNKNIGMFGSSYLGYIQLAAASRKHKSLKCIAPSVAPLGFSDLAYRGGIYSQAFLKAWSDVTTMINHNRFIPKEVYPLPRVLPAAPAVDEDGDGELIDEIPVYNKNGTFLEDPPTYRDGASRENIYYNATVEHTNNVAFESWVGDVYFADTHFPEPYSHVDIYSFVVHSFMPEIMETGIPVYNFGGWHDANVRGNAELYCTMRKTNPSKMRIGAGYHSGKGPYWKYLGEDEKKVMEMYNRELLRYFDRYLKGVENGIDKEPPISIYVQNGEGWRLENEWPLARQKITDFHFDDRYMLSAAKKSNGSDEYTADYTHDSRYGTHLGNRYLGAAGYTPDKLAVRTEKDEKLLTYTSAPMERDVEVTGHPIVNLWVSSTADYGDFFVYLEDVDDIGKVVLVSEGQLRAGFATLVDNDEMGTAGTDILPDLPWHGFESSDYIDKVLADGNIVELYFDLMPTSWVFREGHRIRVAIACADWPTFRLHPKLAPNNKPDDPANIVPTITVYRDAERPSGIKLPVIPD